MVKVLNFTKSMVSCLQAVLCPSILCTVDVMQCLAVYCAHQFCTVDVMQCLAVYCAHHFSAL